jgi:hypothetical protein
VCSDQLFTGRPAGGDAFQPARKVVLFDRLMDTAQARGDSGCPWPISCSTQSSWVMSWVVIGTLVAG